MAYLRIAVEDVRFILPQTFEGMPLILRQIDGARNVAFGKILGCRTSTTLTSLFFIIRSSSTGPVVNAIFASKNVSRLGRITDCLGCRHGILLVV